MWGGRFGEGPDAVMRAINASLPFDKRMWRQDIAGSQAHVAMLGAQGILAAADAKNLPVLLVSLRAPGNYGADFKAEFDAMFGDLAAKYGNLLTENYFFPLIDQSSRLLDPALMQADGIHPNAAGVVKAIESLGPKVRDLLALVVK